MSRFRAGDSEGPSGPGPADSSRPSPLARRGIPEPPLSATSLQSVLTSEGYSPQDERFDEAADQALKDRPYFGFRARLLLSLLALFVLALVVTLWSVSAMSELSAKIDFLEVADEYAEEIQQARRFEKNYLLYGTGLEEAQQHANRAQQLVQQNPTRFEKVVGVKVLDTMRQHVSDYDGLLQALGKAQSEAARTKMEQELRDHGAEMVSHAFKLTDKERRMVQQRLSQARLIPWLFLALTLVVIVVVANVIAARVINHLGRFVEHTDRIGAGDFTPITPGRRYRDEFTDLALHINNMVRQLDRQHRVLVESHKLRAMGTLIAGVAHELNNPLNNIMLTTAVCEEEYEHLDDDERREMLRDLLSEAERARKIVRNLLDFARESDTEVEALELRTIVEETLKLVSNQIRMKRIRLTSEVPEDLPPVHGDRQLLSQVCMNLILNAVDALPEGGKIRIGPTEEPRTGFVGLDFTDNGPGIPEHVLSRIFDPFFTTKPQGKGTGLGLSVSRGIIRKLGGYLLASSRFGKGSTFTVLLPVTEYPPDMLLADRSEAPDDALA